MAGFMFFKPYFQ